MAADEQNNTTPEIEGAGESQGTQQSKPSLLSPDAENDKGKGKATSREGTPAEEEHENSSNSSDSGGRSPAEGEGGESQAQPWQAIFAPQYNTYYFYNAQTGETTWTNPLQSSDSTTTDAPSTGPSAIPDSTTPEPDHPSSSVSQYNALEAAALAQGIDPSLAYLDPSLVTATTSASGGPVPAFQAKFNARTGAFARPDARTPGHLSEFERMKRMSEFYFDVNAWEQELAQEKGEEEEAGKKRKRPTKKDLERFKEQKRLKKIAKTAWLRT